MCCLALSLDAMPGVWLVVPSLDAMPCVVWHFLLMPCQVLFGIFSWYHAMRCLAGFTFTGYHAFCCLAGCTFTGYHARCCLALSLDTMPGVVWHFLLIPCKVLFGTFTGYHARCCLAFSLDTMPCIVWLVSPSLDTMLYIRLVTPSPNHPDIAHWLTGHKTPLYLLTYLLWIPCLVLAGFALCGYHVTVAGFNVPAYHAICSLAAFTFSGYHV